jgi:prevent-host-death family protein
LRPRRVEKILRLAILLAHGVVGLHRNCAERLPDRSNAIAENEIVDAVSKNRKARQDKECREEPAFQSQRLRVVRNEHGANYKRVLNSSFQWSFRYDHVCYNLAMKTIAAGEFKARCLTLMDDVRNNREPIVITKRGKPVAKLVPAENEGRKFLGRLEGIIRIVGDIESPVEPPEAWDALK